MCGERELERRRLERERQLGRESEQVERWQPSVLPQMLFFSRLFGGSFALEAFFPSAQHTADFGQLLRERYIFAIG